MQVGFFDDPGDFLAAASAFLEADPIRLSVIATNAVRAAAGPPEPAVDWPRWYAVVRDADEIAGVAMRTHPAETHPVWMGPMPAAAVASLAEAVIGRREQVLAMTGALPAVEQFAAAMADVNGGEVRHEVPTRLWALESVRWPPRPEGAARQATADDVPLIFPLLETFLPEAAAQAGRELHRSERFVATQDDMRAQIAAGREYLLWEVDGQLVHLTGTNVPAFGTARLGPVLTPKAFRGNGYAAWVVAMASQRILDRGLRPCLYTDITNPVSNAVYARIGYEPQGDSAELSVS